jgi:hypothetical protein
MEEARESSSDDNDKGVLTLAHDEADILSDDEDEQGDSEH